MPRTASVQVAAAIITVHYILSAKDGPEIIIREILIREIVSPEISIPEVHCSEAHKFVGCKLKWT